MSSIREKIIEPQEIVRETCGHDTEIAMFACFCFCPSKKPLFSPFLQILLFQPKFKKIKKCLKGVNKPDILHPRSSKLMKEEYPNTSVTDGQKTNNVVFCLWDDVMKRNGIKLRLCVPLCQRFFLSKRFSNSVHLFQRYCLKTAIIAH